MPKGTTLLRRSFAQALSPPLSVDALVIDLVFRSVPDQCCAGRDVTVSAPPSGRRCGEARATLRFEVPAAFCVR